MPILNQQPDEDPFGSAKAIHDAIMAYIAERQKSGIYLIPSLCWQRGDYYVEIRIERICSAHAVVRPCPYCASDRDYFHGDNHDQLKKLVRPELR